jgi:hypothetical protein
MEGHDREPDPNIRLVTVFQTEDPGLVPLVKSILEDAGIDYYVAGEVMRNVFGWGLPGAYGVGPAEFRVREEDATRAREVLADVAR